METLQGRLVFCEDALEWLKASAPLEKSSMVASLPDRSEFPKLSLESWKTWFSQAAVSVLRACSPEGITVFYQSDIRVEGIWVDKAYLCQRAAAELGQELLFHKIVARAPAGTPTQGRASYSHLLAFSKHHRLAENFKSPDIFSSTGPKVWESGMGLTICLWIADLFARELPDHQLVNPFCGEGSFLAAASFYGLRSLGIERNYKRAERARALKVSADALGWASP